MAGHSKFKNIQHRKGAQDQKRAKIFTKLVREIITAAKSGGSDTISNPRLRTAISTARSLNLPKERIDKALAAAVNPNDKENYLEARYEGFLPGGIAIIVEALTDNKNRTAAEIRSAFNKYGGNLGATGSVSFMFDHVGAIHYQAGAAPESKIMESAIEAGAIDIIASKEEYIIYTSISSFTEIMEYLTDKYGSPALAEIIWHPKDHVQVTEEDKAKKLIKLIELLEENDDVQGVFSNYELSDNLLQIFSG